VARYEANGQVTVIADRFEGKRLNSPNDVVVHPDGSIWFTDPSWGIRGNYEGNKAPSETKEAVYRVDPKTAAITRVAMGDQNMPNGLCFSPDYKKLYVADGAIWVYDVDGATLKNGKLFVQPTVPGSQQRSGADGIRCDTDGNVWAGARPGVLVFSPAGQQIGMIRLPEVCANVCFGGAKRNRLFMTASQSLYAVYVGAVGAHIA
jgi:gluconolactonase